MTDGAVERPAKLPVAVDLAVYAHAPSAFATSSSMPSTPVISRTASASARGAPFPADGERAWAETRAVAFGCNNGRNRRPWHRDTGPAPRRAARRNGRRRATLPSAEPLVHPHHRIIARLGMARR